jgi:hypothetical protein
MSPGTSKGGFLEQDEEAEDEIIDEEELLKLEAQIQRSIQLAERTEKRSKFHVTSDRQRKDLVSERL